ncbi:MAG TPA: DNA translocase FtsK 4TM domain-containing protein [Ferruginibacter sp.]|nr:DNA translocase FtsK 4TM domain-containing protein [Ferruginibacter sp.]HMP21603.1 DNA translocase FtsK 4TM domain-containing protein [Ferruginibacter sp.]
MSKKAKTTKPKLSEKDTLKNETEQKVEVKQLLKDERTHKISGSILLLIAFLLFTAFSSYLFTWEEDQDKVLNTGSALFWGSEDKVSNLLGTLGAYLSHLFIYRGFGIASYFICSFFFVTGVNLFFGKKVFSISRNIKYVLLGLAILSVFFAVAFNGSQFRWGGNVGNMVKDWMIQGIGLTGTWAVLVVAVLSYIIWRFNPAFKLPAKQTLVPADNSMELTPAEITTDATATAVSTTVTAQQEALSGNFLKGNAAMQPVVLDADESATPLFELTEREEEEVVTAIPNPTLGPVAPAIPDEPQPAVHKPAKKDDAALLALEIKTVPEVAPEENPAVIKRQTIDTAYDPILDLKDYTKPGLDLLEAHGSEKIVQDAEELEANKNQIINTLKNYDISIQKIFATVGPTVTLYEIIPAAGVRISRIKNLEDDIALSLAALGIRIIAPIPGKGTIGIEVPNAKKTIVSMKTLLASEKFQNNNHSLPIAIGKKIDNENFIVDLASMPHLLMAGATGQGKSVGLNAILVSLLYKKHPSQLKFVLVDPKKVELSIYTAIEKHFLAKLPGEEDAIITDTKKVVHTLNALCIEMDNRYDLLKEAGCRNIREYNEKFAARKLNPEKGHQYLPFIVLVVDEFADLIMTAGKEVEMPIARLAQLARAVGIHLIIATQRPSVNIITGTIKANFPARIAFKVSSKIDSRTILDTGGAEQLIGKGDMLISYNGEIVRLQCAFVDTPEVNRITDFIGDQRGYAQAFMLPEYVDEKEMEGKDFDLNDKDALFEDAARLIVMSQSGSTSLLQRKMKLGYNRAGRLMDQLEAAGIVGPNQGSKVRDVLIKTEAELQMYLSSQQ